jgi:hypothetical protein
MTRRFIQYGYQENSIRIIDIDDWAISTEIFQFIDELWDPHSVDKFASSNNTKTKLFNSLYWNSGSLGLSSFNSDWSQDVNWLVLWQKALCGTRGVVLFAFCLGN